MLRSMNAEQYIGERLEQFRGWYDSKAVRAKKWYLRIRTTAVIGSALVPVVANLNYPNIDWFGPVWLGDDIQGWVTTAISLVVVIAVALDSVHHFGDQWKNYRSTEQFLVREKFLYLTGEGPYKELDEKAAFLLLVERCEAQISAENSATLNVIATAAAQPEPSTSKVT